jgi:hypothetical protein
MKPSLPVAIIAPMIFNLGYAHANTFTSPTAVSILIDGSSQQPTATFATVETDSIHFALDWLDLLRHVLPNVERLTPDERSSINEFFWSHF